MPYLYILCLSLFLPYLPSIPLCSTWAELATRREAFLENCHLHCDELDIDDLDYDSIMVIITWKVSLKNYGDHDVMAMHQHHLFHQEKGQAGLDIYH